MTPKDCTIYSIIDPNDATCWTDGYDRDDVIQKAQKMYNAQDELKDRTILLEICRVIGGKIVGETEETITLKGGLE